MENQNINLESPEKKILLISYHFPPSAEVGGLRSAHFAKYLSSFHWIPSVLTLEDRYIEKTDQERVNNPETIKIIRVGRYPTFHEAYVNIKTNYFRIFKKKHLAPQKGFEKSAYSANAGRSVPERLPERLRRYVTSLLFTLPDAEKGWIMPAAFRAVREIRKGKINCILTSCPPYSVHIVGLLAKMMTKVKWVADFRDPWMTKGVKKAFPTCALSKKIDAWLEKKVVQKSDLVMFNVQQLRDAYKDKYTSESANKFVHIPNGIDSELLADIRTVNKYDKFTLSYTGTFYIGRSPEPIFKAITQLYHEGRVDLRNLTIKLVGSCQYVGSYSIHTMIHAYGLEQVVEVSDPVSYMTALKIIRKSHLALLFAPGQPYQIPGKIYDYIGVGTTILAITGKGATSDLIQLTNCGRAFDPSAIEDIKEFIFQTMTSKIASERNPSPVASQFDARRISEKLSDHLNRIFT
jgi:Glycosyltransferase Family 4